MTCGRVLLSDTDGGDCDDDCYAASDECLTGDASLSDEIGGCFCDDSEVSGSGEGEQER